MGSLPLPTHAWVTLITRESYLPGAILLAYSLQKQNSKYPLIILYTPSFPTTLLPTLSHEASLSNAILQPISPLNPATEGTLIAERFRDTWTKLRVFSLQSYTKLCFLDADMLCLRDMDEIFDINLPARKNGRGKGIAASHVCCCNLDHDSWAPSNWIKENCPFTPLSHPSALTHPTPVPPLSSSSAKLTRRLLNSGLFLFEPHALLWEDIQTYFHNPSNSKMLSEFLFPDQDFLAKFFEDEWMSVGWQYNALKTWRYWHEEMWRDEEVRNLHFIVDKPWERRVGGDGKAGYRGMDGVTHGWWWREYEEWRGEREGRGEKEVLGMMPRLVAEPLEEGK